MKKVKSNVVRGFRPDQFATVWGEPKKISDGMTQMRVTTSQKDQSGEYVTDFSDYVTFIGKKAAPAALNLKEKDRIKIVKCDVQNNYNKEEKKKYTNFKIFDFEKLDKNKGGKAPAKKSEPKDYDDDLSVSKDDLPF